MNKLLAQFTIGNGVNNGPTYTVNGPTGFTYNGAGISQIISDLLTYVFAFAGVALLLMIISSGFALILSAGDPKKLAKGRASLTNAILGFIIIFAAFWIVQIVGVIFGWETYIGNVFLGR